MALDVLVYVGILVFFCTSVLLFEEGESIDDEGAVIDDPAITRAEIVFAVYLIVSHVYQRRVTLKISRDLFMHFEFPS